MFSQIIKLLAAARGVSLAQISRDLGYSTRSSFQSVTGGRDIRLSVLLSIAKYCNCDIILTNHTTININLGEYIEKQEQESKQE